MEKETITDSLDRLLMAIHRQVVGIRDTDAQIPKAEMDKTLANIRALYEQFTVLNYLNSLKDEKTVMPIIQEPLKVQEVVIPKQTKPEPVEIEAVLPKQPEPVKIEEIVIPKPVEPEPVKTDSPFVPIIEKEPEPVIKPHEMPAQPVKPNVEPIIEKQPEPEHVKQEPIQVATPSEDERFQPKNVAVPVDVPPVAKTPSSSSEPSTLADRLRQQKIDDLTTAVSLSDKFLYINELFGGDIVTYKETLEKANTMNHSSEAESYLDILAQKFQWHTHPKTEKRFRELVGRKFL